MLASTTLLHWGLLQTSKQDYGLYHQVLKDQDAQALIKGLLEKKVEERLGCSVPFLIQTDLPRLYVVIRRFCRCTRRVAVESSYPWFLPIRSKEYFVFRSYPFGWESSGNGEKAVSSRKPEYIIFRVNGKRGQCHLPFLVGGERSYSSSSGKGFELCTVFIFIEFLAYHIIITYW